MTDSRKSWKELSRKGILTIRGIQRGFGEEEVSEVITTARYVKKDGKRFLFYKEFQEGGRSIQSRLTIEDDIVELKKTGGGDSYLRFNPHIDETCKYASPAGEMSLVSKTKKICTVEEAQQLVIDMEYTLYMYGQCMSDYELHINWVEEASAE